MWMWFSETEAAFSLTDAHNPFPEEAKISGKLVAVLDRSAKTAVIDIRKEKFLGSGHPALDQAEETKGALTQFTAFSRIYDFKPWEHNLVPTLINPTYSDRSVIAENIGRFWHHGTEVLPSDIPEELRRTGYGWVSPNANILDFGTPYLMPTHFYNFDADDDDVFSCYMLQWGLYQVGFEDDPLAVADWDDRGALLGLAKQVAGLSAEETLVLRTLSKGTSANIKMAREEYDYRTVRVVAQKRWRKEYSIRPILVNRAIQETGTSSRLDVNVSHDSPYTSRKRSSRNTLRVDKINLVYSDSFNSNPDFRPVPAGRRINFEYGIKQAKQEKFSLLLAHKLSKKNLGSVYRIHRRNGKTSFLIVVKNDDFFLEHKGAFGVHPGDSVQLVPTDKN